MSRIISQDIYNRTGEKFEIITDMQGKFYETEVVRITRENNRNIRKTIDKVGLSTSNLTTALKEHDKIVAKYHKAES